MERNIDPRAPANLELHPQTCRHILKSDIAGDVDDADDNDDGHVDTDVDDDDDAHSNLWRFLRVIVLLHVHTLWEGRQVRQALSTPCDEVLYLQGAVAIWSSTLRFARKF